MLTLYYKPGCPFCNMVLATIDQLGIEVEQKDITADDAVADELKERGGKRQVPYLIDTEKEVEMYDSEAIVSHLKTNYGTGNEAGAAKQRVHMSDSTCVACEG